MWQNRSEKHERPDQPKLCGEMTFSNKVEGEKIDRSKKRIRKSSSELIDSEQLHRSNLKPEKERRLFPKGKVIDLNTEVIVTFDHFPRRFSKVYFVPIKQVNVTKTKEEKGRKQKK